VLKCQGFVNNLLIDLFMYILWETSCVEMSTIDKI